MNHPKMSKKQLILEAALRLFVSQGISNTSTASIAKHAGVATGTLFHHFANKQALCDTLYLQIKTELIKSMQQELPADLLEQGQALWLNALDWFIASPNALRYLQRYYLNIEASENSQQQQAQTMATFRELHQFIYQFFERCQQAGLASDLPLDYLALMAQNSIFSNAEFLLLYPDYNRTEFKRRACQAAMNSLMG